MSIQRLDMSKETLLILLPMEVSTDYTTRLQQKHPGLTIRSHNMRAATGFLSAADLPASTFDNVTILCSPRIPDASLLPEVHTIQLSSAGPDKSVSHPLYLNPSVAISTANGVHGPQIAEWVIASWLSHQHHFAHYAAQQREARWPTDLERFGRVVQDSGDCRMGILGYGAIGREVARLAKGLRMDVVVFTRSEKRAGEGRRDDGFTVPGTGDAEGLLPSKWFHGEREEDVDEFLAQGLDVLVLSLPLTGSTRGMIGERQFGILKEKRTFVVNVSRGELIKTDALIDALETGKIRGAALDVTDPEPLPSEHPLWKAPNVFITPHVSWQTPYYYTRVLKILEQNLERLGKGEKLLNLVDKAVHY